MNLRTGAFWGLLILLGLVTLSVAFATGPAPLPPGRWVGGTALVIAAFAGFEFGQRGGRSSGAGRTQQLAITLVGGSILLGVLWWIGLNTVPLWKDTENEILLPLVATIGVLAGLSEHLGRLFKGRR